MRCAKPGEPQREVLDHRAAEIAAHQHGALVAEVVVHERVHVACVRRDVVEPVRPDVGFAEAAQVGHDDFEAGAGQRLDHAPPDALRLGPAVYEHERPGATCVLVHVRLREAAGARAVRVEPARVDVVHARTLRRRFDERPEALDVHLLRVGAADRDANRIPAVEARVGDVRAAARVDFVMQCFSGIVAVSVREADE